MEQVTSLAEVWDRSLSPSTQNLGTLLSLAAEKHADRPAVASFHQTAADQSNEHESKPASWTYRELHAKSMHLAHCLSAKGVTPGSCVVTVLYNQIEWALIFWAAAHLGCRFVGLDYRAINHEQQARDLLGQLSRGNSEFAIIVADDQLANAVDRVVEKNDDNIPLRCVIDSPPNNTWTALAEVLEAVNHSESSSTITSPRTAADTAVIFFTSGTTGSSKACPHTATTLRSAALGLGRANSMNEHKTICQHLPGFHIYSVVYSLTTWLHGAFLAYPSPRFDAESTIHAIASSNNVFAPCVPLMVQAISKSPNVSRLNGHLESLGIGGSTVHPDLLRLCMSMSPKSISAGYGMSECLVVASRKVSATDALDNSDEDVCLGVAISGSCFRICAPNSRRLLNRCEVGEIHIGGLPVFDGYMGMSHDSCYREDGVSFVVSGDQGYLDQQDRLYVLGRYKDLIIRGGENVWPAKIEQYLSRELDVKAQIVGIPDELTGEAVVVVVQQDSENKIGFDHLRTSVAKDLGSLYTPSTILDVVADLGHDQFPTTASGKPQKGILREWVQEYIKNKKQSQAPVECGTLESQLTDIWASVSGRSATEISPEVSVHTFADSMMLIQVRSIIADRFQQNIAVSELADHSSIRSQSELLQRRAEIRSAADRVQPVATVRQAWRDQTKNQERLAALQHSASSNLAAKGLTWSDVEDVFPKPNIIGPMAEGARSNSWNHRHSMIVRNSDEKHVAAALRGWVERHPLMRSMTTSDKDGEVFMVLAANDTWLQHQLFSADSIGEAEALLTYRLDDTQWDCASPPGPYFKATMLPIRNTSDVGVIFHWHHAIFDGIIIRQWYRELGELLQRRKPSTTFHPFERFATANHDRSQNKAAQRAVNYHVNTLRGLGKISLALWPSQRAPLWLKGNDVGWRYPDGRVGEPEARIALDGTEAIGAMGLELVMPVPNIFSLRAQHEIPPPIVAKGACVLLNLYLTGGEEAILVTNESGRSWPFVDEAEAVAETDDGDSNDTGDDIDPLLIDGPTVTLSVSRNHLAANETVVDFLGRLRREQRDIERNSHASIDRVLEQLETPTATSSASDSKTDGEIVRDALNRQVFDWLPDLRSVQAADDAESKPATTPQPSLEMLEVLSRTDLGFVWYPSLVDGNEVMKLNTTWDDAQLHAMEVIKVMKQFLCAARWLSQPENWQRPASECQFGVEERQIENVGAVNYRR